MRGGSTVSRPIRVPVQKEKFGTLREHSADLEAYILAHGVSKSATPAPKATGF